MHYETEIEINFKTTLGDGFDEDEHPDTIRGAIEQHIEDYCNEHKINRDDVRILRITDSETGKDMYSEDSKFVQELILISSELQEKVEDNEILRAEIEEYFISKIQELGGEFKDE